MNSKTNTLVQLALAYAKSNLNVLVATLGTVNQILRVSYQKNTIHCLEMCHTMLLLE